MRRARRQAARTSVMSWPPSDSASSRSSCSIGAAAAAACRSAWRVRPERVPAGGGAAAAIGAGEALGDEDGQQLGQLEPSTSRTVGRPAANQLFLHLAGGSFDELKARQLLRVSRRCSAPLLSSKEGGCTASAGWSGRQLLRTSFSGAPLVAGNRAAAQRSELYLFGSQVSDERATIVCGSVSEENSYKSQEVRVLKAPNPILLTVHVCFAYR